MEDTVHRMAPMAGQPFASRTRLSARLRRGLILVSAAIALLTVAVVDLVSNTPTASAVTGRRVCAYIEGFDDEIEVPTFKGRQRLNVKEHVGVNYKKGKDCPIVSKPFGEAGEMPDHQPVNQFTCEDYPGQIGAEWTTGSTTTSGKYLGYLNSEVFPFPWSPDVCGNMQASGVYIFYVIPEDHPEIGVNKGDFLVKKSDSIWSHQ